MTWLPAGDGVRPAELAKGSNSVVLPDNDELIIAADLEALCEIDQERTVALNSDNDTVGGRKRRLSDLLASEPAPSM